jgi:DNA-binding response OmpR family regulator
MLPATYLASLRALVVDDMQSMRSALRQALTDAQIRDVHAVSHAEAAVELARSMSFGLVLTDFNLGADTNGQQLMEYLRTRALLPADALFFLVTGDATQDTIACAGEMEPDGFIVKPVTTALLLQRVEEALARQMELKPLHEAVDAGRWTLALQWCDQLIASGSRFRLRVTRLKGQVLGELGRWDDALALYRQVRMDRDLPWAAFGIARCLTVMGDTEAACEELRAILSVRPYHAPANDLLITLLERQADLAGAVTAAAAAAQAIPSALRHRRLADLSLRHGDLDQAAQAATRLVRATARSITRDVADTGMLGEVHLARGEVNDALDVVARIKDDGDPRAGGVRAAVEWLAHSARGDEAAAERARLALEPALGTDCDLRTAMLLAKAGLAAGLQAQALALLDRAAPTNDRSPEVGAKIQALLTSAGVSDAAESPPPEAAHDARRDAQAAVAALRSGQWTQARALARKAEAAAPYDTRMLQDVADVYLLSMHMLDPDPALLEHCARTIAQLRARGTADAKRLEKMSAFLERIGQRATVA